MKERNGELLFCPKSKIPKHLMCIEDALAKCPREGRSFKTLGCSFYEI